MSDFDILEEDGAESVIALHIPGSTPFPIPAAPRFPSDGTARPEGFMLYNACAKGQMDLVLEYIRGGVNLDWQDDLGVSGLLVAAKRGHSQIVKALLAAGANPNISCSFGRTPLLVAATMGHRACVELLILNGADVYLRNRKGKSAADAIVDELRMVKPGQPKYINLAACLELILAKHTRAVHEAEERKSAQERTNLAEIDGAAAVLINPDFALLGMTE